MGELMADDLFYFFVGILAGLILLDILEPRRE